MNRMDTGMKALPYSTIKESADTVLFLSPCLQYDRDTDQRLQFRLLYAAAVLHRNRI